MLLLPERTGRPARAITYQDRIGDWSIGLMYQIDRDQTYDKSIVNYDTLNGQRVVTGFDDVTLGRKRKNTIQGAVQWHPSDELVFAAVYSHSNVERYRNNAKHDNDINAGEIGVSWSPGNWYIAADAGEYHDLVAKSQLSGFDSGGVVDKARGYEFVGLYDFKHLSPGPGHFQLYGGLNRLDDRDSDARNVSYLAGAAYLTLNDNLIFAVEEAFDDSKTISGNDAGNDRTSLAVRYNF